MAIADILPKSIVPTKPIHWSASASLLPTLPGATPQAKPKEVPLPADLSTLPGATLAPKPIVRSLPADLSVIWATIRPDWDELRRNAQAYAVSQDNRVKSVNQWTAALGKDHPITQQLKGDYLAGEKELSRNLVKQYRATVPAGVQEWAKQTPGIGKTSPHMLARLLGHLGHPRLAVPKHWAINETIADNEWGDRSNPKRMLVDGEPYLRSLSQLRQYCGHGDQQRRRAGMTQEEAFQLGNPDCKKLVYLLAGGIVKAQTRRDSHRALGPLGQLWIDTRLEYAERTHTGPCPGGVCVVNGKAIRVRCKVDGRYAAEGDPFQPSHILAIAYRHLGKRILEELFDAAREDWCQS